MTSLKNTFICLFCALFAIDQTVASSAFFQGGDSLGSSLMSVLLIDGLRTGGGFQGAGVGGRNPVEEETSVNATSAPPPPVNQPIIARNPLLLPLLLAGGLGGGGGGFGGLGMLGLPLLLGMGGGGLGRMGGLGGLAPIALLGMSGMGGGGGGVGSLSALAPLALLGMGRFRPYGLGRIMYTYGQNVYKDIRGPAAKTQTESANGTMKVLENGTVVWSPIASANRLRKHFGYGFLWGRRRAQFLKKVADDLQRNPIRLGDMAVKVWGRHAPVDSSESSNGTETHHSDLHRATVLGGKFMRWINKVGPKTKGVGKMLVGKG